MAKASPAIPAVNAGEWWEGYDARVDLEGYVAGCWRLQNFIPTIQGPGEKRPGTRFVAEVKDSSAQTWLVPFRRSRSVSYVLEFGDSYVRFYFNRALILTGSTNTITGATQADPVVVTTSGSHGYSNGQDVFITGVTGMTELNGRFFRVANVTATTFELQDMFSADVDGTGFTAYSSGGTVDKPYEIASPYDEAALKLDNGEFGLDYAQSNDVLYITDRRGVVAPRTLTRTSSTSWAFATVDPEDGPYLSTNSDDTIAMHISAAEGTGVTIQASVAGTFNANMVGALIRLDEENLVETVEWDDGKSITAGDYRRSEGHEYVAASSGTTGTIIPSHTKGTASDGVDSASPRVEWTYVTSGYGVGRITAVNAEGDLATVDVLTTFPQTVVLSTSALSGSAATITGITQADPAVVTTSGAHGWSDGDIVYITGVSGMTEVNGHWYKAANASGTTLELQTLSGVDVDSTGYTAYSSGGTIDEIGVDDFNDNTTTLWRLGAWSTDNGYPEVVSFFLNRLAFGQQTSIYYSQGSLFTSFAPDEKGEVTDESAITLTLASDQVNTIVGMVAGRAQHMVFTEGGEWTISRLQDTGAFGPTNVETAEQTAYGSRPLRPVRVGESTLFVTTTGKKLRESRYSIEADANPAHDMTVRARDIMGDGVTQNAWQSEPYKAWLATRADGQLLNFVFDRDQEQFGWSRFIIGGAFSSGAAVSESVATIASPTNDRDDAFIIVKRTINGATKRYVEYINPRYEDGDDIEDAFYVDSGLTYDGASATTITGLHHLEGQTVSVLADGAVQPDKTVSGGAITISPAASVVQVGFAVASLYASMRIEAGSRIGTAQAKLMKIPHVFIRVYRSRGGQMGLSETDLTLVPGLNDRAPADLMDQASGLISGDVQVRMNERQTREPRIWLSHSTPLPFTLLGVYPAVNTKDNNA